MKLRPWALAVGATAWLIAASPAARGASVALTPSKDNTVYGESETYSNGASKSFFSGKTNSFHTRRALIAFDVAGSIPPGSAVSAVTLTLYVSNTPDVGVLDDHDFSLHPLTADWGEGASNSGGPGGAGVQAEPGDATWLHRFYDTTSWATPGGDFVPAPSATLAVGDVGYWDWDTTPALVADVQGWLDDPATNFGWILIGDELDIQNARRFDSRNHPLPANRPVLTVEFDPPAAAAGAVPDGAGVPGAPLSARRLGNGDLRLSWSPSCRPGDVDYGVYEGTLGDWASHAPVTCSTSGLPAYVFTPLAGTSTYYLVVPSDGSVEGSYGRDGAGDERAAAVASCLPQVMADPLCP